METIELHIEAFKNETLMLLRFYLAYKRIAQLDGILNMSREDLADKFFSLKAIENDFVLRICKFDDGRKDTHSFNRALKMLPKSFSYRKEYEDYLIKFKITIKNFKQRRRHEQLAHLKLGSSDCQFGINLDLLPSIKLIVRTVDILSTGKVNYIWKDGSYEEYDLRNEIKIDSE